MTQFIKNTLIDFAKSTQNIDICAIHKLWNDCFKFDKTPLADIVGLFSSKYRSIKSIKKLLKNYKIEIFTDVNGILFCDTVILQELLLCYGNKTVKHYLINLPKIVAQYDSSIISTNIDKYKSYFENP